MDEFVSIVDSSPEHDIPKQAVKRSKRLFIKGLFVGIGIALCIGGIIQYIISRVDHPITHKILPDMWFGINIWSWCIGLLILAFITVRNII